MDFGKVLFAILIIALAYFVYKYWDGIRQRGLLQTVQQQLALQKANYEELKQYAMLYEEMKQKGCSLTKNTSGNFVVNCKE